MSRPNVDQRSACNMARKQPTAKKKVSMKSFCSKLLDNVYAWMYGCVCMLEGCMYESVTPLAQAVLVQVSGSGIPQTWLVHERH